jgi:hypothetical protein
MSIDGLEPDEPQSEIGYTLMQDRITQIDEIFLHRTAGPYIWVNLGPSALSAECRVTLGSGH